MTDSLLYIGTATTLLQLDGVTILTDPTFLHAGNRQHLGWGLFSTKLIDPVMDDVDLNTVDVVLLTHLHRDHWDDIAAEMLPKTTPIITNSSCVKFLINQGFQNVIALEPNEHTTFQQLVITALSAEHGPWYIRPFTGNVIGFGIESSSKRLWISGDTISTETVRASVSNYKPTSAVIYFGGVRVYGVRITFDGIDALNMIQSIDTLQQTIGVHIDDWSHFRSDRTELQHQFDEVGYDLIIPRHGEKINL